MSVAIPLAAYLAMLNISYYYDFCKLFMIK